MSSGTAAVFACVVVCAALGALMAWFIWWMITTPDRREAEQKREQEIRESVHCGPRTPASRS